MSEVAKARQYLKDKGYELIRTGAKHETWGKGVVKLSLPRGKSTDSRFFNFAKQTMRHAEYKAGLRKTLKG